MDYSKLSHQKQAESCFTYTPTRVTITTFDGAFMTPMQTLQTIGLFVLTAIAEIVGCYLPYLILNQQKSAWLWLPTVVSLGIFVYLLSLHPAASGRIYAAYGGIYVICALIWLATVDRLMPSAWDLAGGALVVIGALVIILQPDGFGR